MKEERSNLAVLFDELSVAHPYVRNRVKGRSRGSSPRMLRLFVGVYFWGGGPFVGVCVIDDGAFVLLR